VPACKPENHWKLESRLRNAAGDFRWHFGRAVRVRGEHGQIVQWAGTSTDIHARKCDAAGHDLQSPLRTIIN
jgi:PAS domain-containing protein